MRPLQVDVYFDRAEQLQPLPRLIFALQSSALLHGPRPAEADKAQEGAREGAKLRALMCGLGPPDLAAVLYPALSSWASPEAQACPL